MTQAHRSTVERYREYLEPRFPREICDIYEQIVWKILEEKAHHRGYQEACRYLRRMVKLGQDDMAVGQLLLKSFWSNEAIFQLMMLAYNLFLLFKIDRVQVKEYRQQIMTFRLKYIFLAGKIVRTARRVVMKLSERYPYQEIYE